MASLVSQKSGGGWRYVLGKIGPQDLTLSSDTSQAGVWGMNGNSDGAHGVKGETTGFGAGARAPGNTNGIGRGPSQAPASASSAHRRPTIGIFGGST